MTDKICVVELFSVVCGFMEAFESFTVFTIIF